MTSHPPQQPGQNGQSTQPGLGPRGPQAEQFAQQPSQHPHFGQTAPQQGAPQVQPGMYGNNGASQPGQPPYPGQPPQPPFHPGMMPPPAPPKKRNWFARHKILTAIGIILFLIIFGNIVGGGKGKQQAEPANTTATEQHSTDGSSNASEAPSNSSAPQQAPAGNAPAPLGTPVKTDDFQVVVTNVETGVSRVGNEYFGEDAQGQFVVVSVEVTNVGTSGKQFSASRQQLVDNQGREHDVDTGASIYGGDKALFYEEINPGNTAKGTLVFDIPKDTVATKVLLRGGIFGTEVEAALQ